MMRSIHELQATASGARQTGLPALTQLTLSPPRVGRSQSMPQINGPTLSPKRRHRSRATTSTFYNIASIERPAVATPPSPTPTQTPALLAHEFIQGNLVRFTSPSSQAARPPPTVVLVHGILGSRRNMVSFARRLVEGFPSWQVLLVDLRCHGESATTAWRAGPHTVESAAADILQLLQAKKLFPEMLIGHSFGGKVVMSMAHQFGNGVKRLPRPVKVWVLDALPGEVRSGEMGATDRPVDLISALLSTPLPIARKEDLISRLVQAGFSMPVASWAALNLAPVDANDRSRGLTWSFDLHGIAEMYQSYETTCLWQFLATPAAGIQLAFVKAERSTFRWGGGDEDMIRNYGHPVYELANSGHWVHTDNPDGLFDILAHSFGGATPDLHLQRRGSSDGTELSHYN